MIQKNDIRGASIPEMLLTSDGATVNIGSVTKPKVVPDLAMDSARMKKMFNDIDSDVVFAEKMQEVSKVALAEYVVAEKRRKEEKDAEIAAG